MSGKFPQRLEDRDVHIVHEQYEVVAVARHDSENILSGNVVSTFFGYFFFRKKKKFFLAFF